MAGPIDAPGSDGYETGGAGGFDSVDGGNDFLSGFDTRIIDPTVIDAGSGDSGSATGAGADGEPIRRRRGRAPGTKNKSSTSKANGLAGIEQLLLSSHAMLAAITSWEELKITEAEANNIAVGVSRVASHYDLQASQKSLDWANLLMVLCAVYGMKFYQVNARVKKGKASKAETVQPDNVVGLFRG